MQSKTVINILAFIALIGITSFGALTILGYNDAVREENLRVKNNEVMLNNSKIFDRTLALQASLSELRQENDTIKNNVLENKKSLEEANSKLVDLKNEEQKLLNEIAMLTNKKSKLNEFLFELRKEIDTAKTSQAVNLETNNREISNNRNLLLNLKKLEAENEKLRIDLGILKTGREETVLNLSETLNDLNEELERTKKK